jgi:hypothetical protein
MMAFWPTDVVTGQMIGGVKKQRRPLVATDYKIPVLLAVHRTDRSHGTTVNSQAEYKNGPVPSRSCLIRAVLVRTHLSRGVSRSSVVPSPTIRIATPVTLPTISA